MGFMDMFRPKYKHSDPQVRIEAVKEIEDQKILTEIATTDEDTNVRKKAVEKISNKESLIDSKYSEIRREALKDITNGSILIDIAKNDSNWKVRREAIYKIKDKSVLIDISKNDKDPDVRDAAMRKIGIEYRRKQKEYEEKEKRARMKLRCRYCKGTNITHIDQVEVDGLYFDSSGFYCHTCGRDFFDKDLI